MKHYALLIAIVISISLNAQDITIPDDDHLNIGIATSSNGSLSVHNASCCFNTVFDYKGHLNFRDADDNTWKSVLTLQDNGTVLIGTNVKFNSSNIDTRGHKLSVKGGILCEEVEVISNVPSSDYIFENDYKLMPLEELEQFVQQNKHLPEVPTAEEFKENGYKVGDMDDLLLRKIEELTLYVIGLKKENELLKKKIDKIERNN